MLGIILNFTNNRVNEKISLSPTKLSDLISMISGRTIKH